jgi:GT2 family glycosyltransferase
MTLGAVIVTWNSGAHIGACLDALRRHEPSIAIAVVDNASSDNTLAEARARTGILVQPNPQNRGFAGAVNQGIDMLWQCDLVLVLNPDAQVQTNLGALALQFADAKTGACGGRLLDATGEPQTGFELRRFPTAAALVFETLGLNRLWPSNPVNRRYRCLDIDASVPCPAEQPAGAFLMVRREAWAQVGGFDESFYPVWFEDVDFLKRLDTAGWTIRFTPQATAVHAGGHSVSQLEASGRTMAWYGSLLRYAVRHCSYAGRAAVCWAVFASALPRAAMEAVRGRSFRPFFVCAGVMRISLSACVSSRFAGKRGMVLKPVLPAGVQEYAKLVNSGDRSPH